MYLSALVGAAGGRAPDARAVDDHRFRHGRRDGRDHRPHRDRGLAVLCHGAVAIFTSVAVHRLVSLMRFNAALGKLADHRVRVLVADGELRTREPRRCGLTDNDIFSQLGQRGVFSLSEVRYVLPREM